ncbi:MAG: hypothetical protein ACREFZ_10750 [Acetobacteraceae bacterium]
MATSVRLTQDAAEILAGPGDPKVRLTQVAVEILVVPPRSVLPPGGLLAPPGLDPQIVLQLSDDGGKTWGRERSASLGKIGEYRTLVCFPRLGRSRNRAFRSICSAPVLFAIFEADLDAEATDR